MNAVTKTPDHFDKWFRLQSSVHFPGNNPPPPVQSAHPVLLCRHPSTLPPPPPADLPSSVSGRRSTKGGRNAFPLALLEVHWTKYHKQVCMDLVPGLGPGIEWWSHPFPGPICPSPSHHALSNLFHPSQPLQPATPPMYPTDLPSSVSTRRSAEVYRKEQVFPLVLISRVPNGILLDCLLWLALAAIQQSALAQEAHHH